jgi:ferrous iron transport protein A
VQLQVIHNNSVYSAVGKVVELNSLGLGQSARVAGFAPGDTELEMKLREIGFAEGDDVELLHRGPVGGTPVSIRLARTIIALRRKEAAAILVELPE